jgi:AhpD family alkylhydroperoxidase
MTTSPSTDRFFLDKADPAVWKALNGFALQVRAAAEAAGLDRALVELASVRISQINGCAYCLDLHTRLAREAGQTEQRLAVLPAWREAGIFSEVEQAALVVAEAATILPDEETRLADLDGARTLLTDPQYSALQWLAIAMNAYNRVSILSRHPVTQRGDEADQGDRGQPPAPADGSSA